MVDLKHIKQITFTECWPGYEVKKVAIFDDRKISGEEVTKLLKCGEPSPFVIVATETQCNNVFGSLMNHQEE